MKDLISRQAAIDVLRNRWLKTKNYEGIGEDIAEECEIYLRTVPSAQPESKREWYMKGYRDAQANIVQCEDCKWRRNQNGTMAWIPCRALVTPDDFYCKYAERKEQ